MMGKLEQLIAERGSGVAIVERVTGREPLGSWPGARGRATFWIHAPRPGGELRRALLTVGVETVQGAATPVRARVRLNGAGVTREIRPQFAVELDDTMYYKAVYDVTPILRSRHARQGLHKLQVFYDLAQPLYFRDATLIIIASTGKAEYALSALTGAKVLEPGEVTVEYPSFYETFGGERRATLTIHSPYHESGFEVVVAGYRAGPLQGSGSFPVSVEFRYGGSLVPVSVKYLPAPYSFYPKRAVVTDIVLEEVRLPRIDIDLSVEAAKIEGGKLVVEVGVENRSEVSIERPTIAVVALGGQLSSHRLRELPPGSGARARLIASIERLPVRPSTILVSFSGYALGRRIERGETVQL